MSHFPRETRWIGVAILAVASLTLGAQELSPEARLRAGDALLAERRYQDAFDAYRQARAAEDVEVRVRAGAGAIRTLLRVGRYDEAVRIASDVATQDPTHAEALAAQGDALWAAGMFFEAEDAYDAALVIDEGSAAALHGRGRSLAAQSRLAEGLSDVTRAAATNPKDPMYMHTLGAIYEQMWRFQEAEAAYRRYLAMLSGSPDDDMVRAAKVRIQFLNTFQSRRPFRISGANQVHTVPFRLVNGRAIVRARLNGGPPMDFTLDTGTDATIITPPVAQRSGIKPINTLQSAGVGAFGWGLRDLQIARLDRFEVGDLRIDNIPAIIKSPSLNGLPTPETEAFSPLALGLSMRIDYERQLLTLGTALPAVDYETTLPLRMQRLAMVRATVNGTAPASFVLDTGGQATAISRYLATGLHTDPNIRRVPARVYGTSGWDPTAFLLPFTKVELANGVGFQGGSVVVLNLEAPSAMLGVNLGGIIGHEFLSRYEVSIDLQRTELGLRPR